MCGSIREMMSVCGLACVASAAFAAPPGSPVDRSARFALDPFPAGGAFTDNFDSYPLGEICGMGGWEEWAGSIDVCASVSDEQALSGSQSLKLVGAVGGKTGLGDDTVQQVSIDEGQWTFSAQTFVPDEAEGSASLILLNTYPPIGNEHWSVVVELNADFGTVTLFTGELTTLVKGEWVEFRAEIDLEADEVDYFYNGVEFVSDKSWTGGILPGGEPRIRAIDLYGHEPGLGGTTGTYIDDVSLVPAGGGCPADCNADGQLNILDFVCFQGEFGDQTPFGDCDDNAQYNILDFICYQGLFSKGCP